MDLKHVSLLTQCLIEVTLGLHDVVLPVLQEPNELTANELSLLLRQIDRAFALACLHPLEMHVLNSAHECLEVNKLRLVFVCGTHLGPESPPSIRVGLVVSAGKTHPAEDVERHYVVDSGLLVSETKCGINLTKVFQKPFVNQLR